MFGITPFGMFHTVIALIAVAAGFTALARDREIGLATVSAAGSAGSGEPHDRGSRPPGAHG